ncbi:hypothetical protein ACQY0O_008344 [Thecaphora frezii]
MTATATAPARRLVSLFSSLAVSRAPHSAGAAASSSRARTFTSSVVSRLPSLSNRPVPPPRPNLSTPAQFLASISRPRRDLASNSSAVSALGDDWSGIFSVDTQHLKEAGLGPKDRKYILWAIEKLRQGGDPAVFAYAPKPKKKIRGWGPRVQTSERIRVRGRKRPGEK